jgi:hypothetical protein
MADVIEAQLEPIIKNDSETESGQTNETPQANLDAGRSRNSDPVGSDRPIPELYADAGGGLQPDHFEAAPAEKSAGAPAEKAGQKSAGAECGHFAQKSAGISQEKRGGISAHQQLTGKMPALNARTFSGEVPAEKSAGAPAVLGGLKPADLFRYEIEFRSTKKGYSVSIRKRLRWSQTRHSRQVAKGTCPDLTAKQVAQARAGKFNDAAIKAIKENKGNVTYEHIELITKRKGRGAGLRFADLDPRTKLLLAGFERMLTGNDRAGTAEAGPDAARTDTDHRDMPEASGPDLEAVEPVPYVH